MKILKIWRPKSNYRNCPKIEQFKFLMQLKDVDGMADSVEPDQTALSSLILVYIVCSDSYVPIFRIFLIFELFLYLILRHSERPKLHTILAFFSAVGLT